MSIVCVSLGVSLGTQAAWSSRSSQALDELVGAGSSFVVPASIDATGATDVTDELNDWLANSTADGVSANPNRIVLDGIFRVEYGVTIGSTGTDVAHPDLAPYTRNHVVIDLTNATLLQLDPTPYSNVAGIVTEPRKRFGVPVIKIVGGQDITVLGGHLLSSNVQGAYSRTRAAWHGVTVVGTDGVTLAGLHIEGVWGDFVYLNHKGATRARDVLLDGGVYERNGRQGVTMNAVDGLEIAGVEFLNIQRVLFDHEPDSQGGATSVFIHDCSGQSGGLGFLSLRPRAATPLHDIVVRNHHLQSGHFRITADTGGVQRSNFVFVNNTTDATAPYTGVAAMITVGGSSAGWDGVTIQDNHDVGTTNAPAVSVNAPSTGVVTTPNDFVGFLDS
jgi:hypothetical protein